MNPDEIPRLQYSTGKWYKRSQWDKDHKPTCKYRPCEQWSNTHWHFSKDFLFDPMKQASYKVANQSQGVVNIEPPLRQSQGEGK